MTETHRSWRLVARPQGMIKDSDFAWTEGPIPEPGPGQVLVHTLYLSVDPAQRSWMERDTYVPAVPLGDVMRSTGVGRVLRSNVPAFTPGDLVQGMVGWQSHAVLEPGPWGPTKIQPNVPPTLALSALGLTGVTAHIGLLEIGRPKPGETVVVSGAAGATGSMVGQIAKLKGCRAIGVAGGKEKCDWITQELRFDGAIDYKSEDVGARLRELCPRGVDIYFDNVGGDILDAALARLSMRGRVVLCGAIADYNSLGGTRGPNNYLNLLNKRGRMEGFIVTDYAGRFPDVARELGAWIRDGRIKERVDVTEGLENAPAALRRLFTGANIGKQLVKVADA